MPPDKARGSPLIPEPAMLATNPNLEECLEIGFASGSRARGVWRFSFRTLFSPIQFEVQPRGSTSLFSVEARVAGHVRRYLGYVSSFCSTSPLVRPARNSTPSGSWFIFLFICVDGISSTRLGKYPGDAGTDPSQPRRAYRPCMQRALGNTAALGACFFLFVSNAHSSPPRNTPHVPETLRLRPAPA